METKSARDKIEERRLTKLRWLQSCCKQVITCAEETLKKIEAEGVSGNYSCNHDIQKWSERVHRVSYEMWLLSDLSNILQKEDSSKKELARSKNLSSKKKKSNKKITPDKKS